MKWTEITVKTTTEASDIVAQILFETGAGGVVIVDKADYNESNVEVWDYLDAEELTSVLDEEVLVKAYLPEDAALSDKLTYVKQRLNTLSNTEEKMLDWGLLTINLDSLNEEDWRNEWKKYYKPFTVSERIVIKPTWENYEVKNGETVIQMDPGMAFGTGIHETTRLCAAQLCTYVNENSSVIDVGCGTGILSMIAQVYGAKQVLAIDLDKEAIKAAQNNIELNSMQDKITVKCGNLLDEVNIKADIIVANIIADVIIYLADKIKAYINDGGIFIASGIINSRSDEVEKEFTTKGYIKLDKKVMGEWTAFAFQVK